jgi:D-galactose 1-dehydrogenase
MHHRIAIVGVGKIARDQHIPAISASSDFELAATASRHAEIGGVPAYRDLAALLRAHTDISCISLCTPPQVRYADARAAIEAGRHVMLEKPPGATISEVHNLVDLAEKKGVSLFATWHSRHAAAVAAARDWLSNRDVREIRIDWKEDVRYWHPGQDWVWQAGGLGVFDPGINALSVLTAILPQNLHLANAELSFPSNRETPIAARLDFSGLSGARISADFDWREEGDPLWNIHVTTDGGEALLSQGGARLTVNGEERHCGPNREYAALYARFAELVRSRESEVDLAPLYHVADAFTLGRRVLVAPFDW